MNVLIVEDNSLIRLWYRRRLRSFGWVFTACQDAAEALEACQQTCYPLIICELKLPDMDGLEFCRRIRPLPHGKKSKILVISERHTSEDIQAAMKAGADEFFSKPLCTERFKECVTDLVQEGKDYEWAEQRI